MRLLMLPLLAAAFSVSPQLSSPAAAKCASTNSLGKCTTWTESGRCLIEIGGKKYADGKCRIEVELSGYRYFAGKYFVYVSFNANDRSQSDFAAWNGINGGSHAHDSLGTLAAQGSNCWVNSTTKVCGWY